jgi:uncharacterized membrane protein
MPGPDIGGFMDGVFLFTIVTVVASLAVPLIIVGVVIWAIRRRRDPAEEALRERLARGEIDQAEFLVRMRALHDGDDASIT